jgi:type IV secretory pathway TrbD component
MLTTNQWIAAGFGVSLVVAALAGMTAEGFSISHRTCRNLMI